MCKCKCIYRALETLSHASRPHFSTLVRRRGCGEGTHRSVSTDISRKIYIQGFSNHIRILREELRDFTLDQFWRLNRSFRHYQWLKILKTIRWLSIGMSFFVLHVTFPSSRIYLRSDSNRHWRQKSRTVIQIHTFFFIGNSVT